MEFVVDSNVLITYFWKNSIFQKICTNNEIDFFAPKTALCEIDKYMLEIIKKAKISMEQFKTLRKEILERVVFVSEKHYIKQLRKAARLAKDLPEKEKYEFLDDISFIALALELKTAIWTNDKLLKVQKEIPIFNTKEIIELFDELFGK